MRKVSVYFFVKEKRKSERERELNEKRNYKVINRWLRHNDEGIKIVIENSVKAARKDVYYDQISEGVRQSI